MKFHIWLGKFKIIFHSNRFFAEGGLDELPDHKLALSVIVSDFMFYMQYSYIFLLVIPFGIYILLSFIIHFIVAEIWDSHTNYHWFCVLYAFHLYILARDCSFARLVFTFIVFIMHFVVAETWDSHINCNCFCVLYPVQLYILARHCSFCLFDV